MKEADEYESPAESLGDIIEDPETKAVQFTSISNDGEVVSWGMGDGSETSLVELAAAGLLHSARKSDTEQTEFIKKVVEEYNVQKKSDHTTEL